MALKILCVAEKPYIAKSVAQHLGGGRVRTVSGPKGKSSEGADVMLACNSRQSICQEL